MGLNVQVSEENGIHDPHWSTIDMHLFIGAILLEHEGRHELVLVGQVIVVSLVDVFVHDVRVTHQIQELSCFFK